MRLVSLILLFIANSVIAQQIKSHSRTQKEIRDLKYCQLGTDKAVDDFAQGDYILQTLGQNVDTDFQPFFIKVAKEKYNIRLSYADCVVSPEQNCYNRTMRAKVLSEFGNDIETRIKNEALLEYKNSELYKTVIKPKIDSGFTYANGHSNPLFPEGETGMRAFIKDNIRETKKPNWRSIVKVTIEKNGAISNISFKKEPEAEIKNEIVRLLKLMPVWYPATYQNKKVSQEVIIPFFSKKRIEMKEKNSLKNSN